MARTPLFIVQDKVEARLKDQLTIDVYDAAPFAPERLPYVAQLEETDDKRRLSAAGFLHEVRSTLEIVTDPHDEAATDLRTLMKEVAAALETHTWDFSAESFTVNDHHVETARRFELEGEHGEQIYRAEIVYLHEIDEVI